MFIINNASGISLVTLNKDGNISLTSFIDRSDYREHLIPAFARMVEPVILVVPDGKSNKQGVLRLTF